MTAAVHIAVVGDHFMLPEVLADAVTARCAADRSLHIRQLKLDWPNEPMQLRNPQFPEIDEFVGDPDAIAEFIGDAEIFVNHVAPLTAGMLERLPQLKLVAVTRGGPVNIDMQAAARHQVAVVNAPGRNAEAVAEFTVGAILCETRRIRTGHEALREGKWRGELYRADLTGNELSSLTVGIIGYGRVGTLLARLLRPFACQVIAHDPFVAAGDEFAQLVPTLEELLRTADIVVLNARVTPQTANLMNRERIALMKHSAVLVNAARGPLLDYDALYDALAHGRLSGAVLDTFADEPPPADSPLLKLANVTLTPHIAGASRQTVHRAAALVAEDVTRYLDGKEPLRPAG